MYSDSMKIDESLLPSCSFSSSIYCFMVELGGIEPPTSTVPR